MQSYIVYMHMYIHNYINICAHSAHNYFICSVSFCTCLSKIPCGCPSESHPSLCRIRSQYHKSGGDYHFRLAIPGWNMMKTSFSRWKRRLKYVSRLGRWPDAGALSDFCANAIAIAISFVYSAGNWPQHALHNTIYSNHNITNI